MDVSDAIRRRRMTRSFTGEAVDATSLDRLCDLALRAPTAGNSRGVELLILRGEDEVSTYFSCTTDARWRSRSARYAGLSRAGAVIVVLADPSAYVDRYAAEDKVASGLGEGAEAWPVPYWVGDAGAATMALLLACEEEGLGCCFLGAFRGAEQLLEAVGARRDLMVYGAVLIGKPDGADHRSASLDRPGASRAERIHRGRIDRLDQD
jgi:nitroreductase